NNRVELIEQLLYLYLYINEEPYTTLSAANFRILDGLLSVQSPHCTMKLRTIFVPRFLPIALSLQGERRKREP
ncbi:13584_t:CDS:1, partial [Acaulospora colombiana]